MIHNYQCEPLEIKQDVLVDAALSDDPVRTLSNLYWNTVRGTGLTRFDCDAIAELHTQFGVKVDANGYLTFLNTPTNERVKVVS